MKKRILFIDDEKFLLEQLQIALADYEVITADSALKGMKLASEMDFDAVLLDIMMPPSEDMDPETVNFGRFTGVELCRRIRKMKPDIPIIILSVVRDQNIMEQINKAGASRFINKPVMPGKVSEILSEVLNVK